MERNDLMYLIGLAEDLLEAGLSAEFSALRNLASCENGELVGFALNVRRACRSAINQYAISTGGCEYFYDVCLG